jgi:AraC-like DNA-binding protein
MKCFLLILTTFFCIGLSAQSHQQQQIDSLRNVLSQFEGEEKISEYRKLILKYFDKNMDTVLFQLFDDAENETQKSGDFEQQRLFKFFRLKAFYNRFMFDEIIKTAPKHLEFFRHKGKENHTDYFNIYYMLIKALIITNDIETATAHTEQMYEEAKTMQSDAGKAVALYTMGEIYNGQIRYNEQEKALVEAIELFEAVDDINLINLQENAYMSLCDILLQNNRFDETSDIIRKYEKYIQNLNAKSIIIPHYNFWELNIMYNIQTGNYDKAELYCDTLDNAAPIPVLHIHCLVYKLKIFAGRGQYDKALEIANKAIELTSYGEKHTTNEIRRLKMDILAKTKQTDELLKLALYTIEFNDSLYHKDLAYQIDELRTKYEVDKHIREKKYMRNFTYISILASILTALILLIWVRYSRIINIKNQGLMRRISEQDAMYAEIGYAREQELEQRNESNPDEIIDNNINRAIFARLNKLMKEQRLFADQNISRFSIATALGVSERILYDCIKSNTGMNFTTYITHLRLIYARQLISAVDNQLTMESIAIEAGFGSRSTFYRLFKENYGLSPDEFRKLKLKTKNEEL